MEFSLEKARCEKKFVVSDVTKEDVESIVKEHSDVFSEIFYEREVNNIYFDSVSMRSFLEHLSGFDERLKIRIRWYGEMFGKIKNPVLEIKVKKNELANKLHFPLKPFSFDRNFSLSGLRKVFSSSNLPKWLEEELKLSFPVLLNCYKRKYFLSKNKKFRLTLDTDLKFLKINSNNNLFLEKIDSDEKILELKYNFKDYEEAGRVCQALPFRMNANSKFIQGINLFEL